MPLFGTLSTQGSGANSVVIRAGSSQMVIQQQINEANTRIFGDFDPFHSWGIYHLNATNNIEFTRLSLGGTTPVIRFFTEPGPGSSNANTAVMSTVNLETGTYNSIGGINEPYAQIEDNDGQTFPADSWTTINYGSGVQRGRHISTSGSGNPNINFTRTGVYFAAHGMRIGVGGDVWTGFRVLKNNSTIMSYSYGTGQVSTNDPGPLLWNTIFVVDDITVPYQMQVYRAGSSMGTTSPAQGPAFCLTLFRISSQTDV
jgi:hypothetical protein